MLIGAHMSIAGGIHKALLLGKEMGCATVQVFVRANAAWHAGTLTDAEIAKFALAQQKTGISPVIAHNCYLVNLASTNEITLARSLEATAGELQRTEVLGITGLVMHPGAHLGAGEKAGLRKIARGIDRAIRDSGTKKVRILLETAAGQGTMLGSRFEELAEIISLSKFPERLGVCFDTCHAFAAGYDIRTKRAYNRVMADLDRIIGISDRLGCIHLNDSKQGLGSHRDRHEHLGKGELGEEPFRFIMRDARLVSVPKILETPKGTYRRRPWDKRNLDTLRRLAEK